MALVIRSMFNVGVCRNTQRLSNSIVTIRNRTFHHRREVTKSITVTDSRNISILARPLLFTSLGTTSCFAACAIWQYEYLRYQLKNANKRVFNSFNTIPEKYGVIRAHAYSIWSNFSPGQKTVASIIFLNCAAFLLWRIPYFQSVMSKFFTTSPFSGAPSLSILFSMFSHVSFLHLFCNMYALWTFSQPLVKIFGKEQFVAMYVSGGLFSGLCSHFVKVLLGTTLPSLGASGAVLAVVGAVSSYFPDSQVSIIGLDYIYPHSFSASTAVKALIAIDLIGVLARWRMIDHAAHLGGVLYGIWYLNYGHKIMWGNREHFLKWYHSNRGKP